VAAVLVVSGQSPVDSAPLRDAMGRGLTASTGDNLTEAGVSLNPPAAAASRSEPTSASLNIGRGEHPALQRIRPGLSTPAAAGEGHAVRIDSATFSAMAGLAPLISVADYARSLAKQDAAGQL